MEAVIEARSLTRSFGSLTAVDRLSLSVYRGEIFGLVGPDGAGKTTTLRLLCGLLDPTGGEARVAGRNVAREPDAVKDRIYTFAPQNPERRSAQTVLWMIAAVCSRCDSIVTAERNTPITATRIPTVRPTGSAATSWPP